LEDLKIRVSVPSDKDHMIEWLSEEAILRWFPMQDMREIEDAVNVCMGYVDHQSILTVEYKNQVCAMACLYIHFFKKFSHQALFMIIVKKEFRSKKIGERLIKELMKVAKEKFKIEILHLEVYDENPAISFYERLGFEKYGYQKDFIKEKSGKYLGKTLMQKYL
jgi:putative acetyltransferase